MRSFNRVLCLLVLFASVAYLADGVSVMSIDFGSEFIKVAIVKPGVPMEVALNKESRRKSPNVVSMRNGERLFGGPAVNVGLRFPKFAFRYLLHILGEKFDSVAVRQYSQRFPHHKLVKDDARGTACIEYSDTEVYCVEELVAMMLNNSRDTAQNFAEQPIKDVVITVPIFFTQAQRRALIYAAELVGLNVRQLMHSGSAVGLNYGVFRQASFNDTEQNLMFFDMGSTSTIATIVSYQTVKVKELGFSETVPQLTVRSVGFDRTLGGLEMDMRLRDHLATIFDSQKKTKESVRTSPRAMAKLLKEANRVKQVLSANLEHYAQIEGLLPDIDFRAKVTREDFEKMCEDLFARVQAPIEQALKSAKMDATDLQQVIVIGGGSRVPKVQQLLLEATKKTELGKSVNSDEAAALGASYAAAGWSKAFRIKKFKVKDLNLYPLEVAYDRATDTGETRRVERSLYSANNQPPMKKVMTINHISDKLQFSVGLCNLTQYLSTEQVAGLAGAANILQVSVSKLADIRAGYSEDVYDSKGVKVHFNLDAGAVLSVDRLEAVFQRKNGVGNDTKEPSTLSNIVDGISSFFTAPSKSGDDEESSVGEDSGDTAKSTSTSSDGSSDEQDTSGTDKTASHNDTTSANTTATGSNQTASGKKNSTKPAPPLVIKVPLKFVLEYVDVAQPTEATMDASKQRLQGMADKDLEKALLEAAKNTLEAYIFDMQDKMSSSEYTESSEEDERSNVTAALSTASDWLYEEGDDASRESLEAKLASLKTLAESIVKRVKDHSDRPEYVKKLRNALNASRYFIEHARNLTKPLPGYVANVYTKVEVDTLETLFNDTGKWLNETEAEQAKMKKTLAPVLTVPDISEKLSALAREVSYLDNKAKYFVPTKKKVRSKSENVTANSTADSNANTSSSTDKKSSDQEDTSADDKSADSAGGDQAKSTADSQSKRAEGKAKRKPAADDKDTESTTGDRTDL